MLELYTIATLPEKLKEHYDTSLIEDFESKYQAHPGDHCPLFNTELGGIIQAKWKTSIPSINIKRVMKQRPFNLLIRSKRALVPANCFFGQDGEKVYGLKPMHERLFSLAVVYEIKNEIPQFTLLTTEAPPILKGFTDEIPIIVSKLEHDIWLNTPDLEDVFSQADLALEHWFDFFPVSKEILEPNINQRDLLKPIGPSLKDVQTKENMGLKKEAEHRRITRGK